MKRILICEKMLSEELWGMCSIKYFLLIHSGEFGRIYGVEIEKKDACGNSERNAVLAISEKRKEAEGFLSRLWRGNALPVELAALYDDFISEREWAEDHRTVLTAC